MAALGPNPYDFQPVFTPHELEERRRRVAEAAVADRVPNDLPMPPDRMANNEWCSCGNCLPIDSPIQCKCCREVVNCENLIEELDGSTCITDHPDFSKICQEKAVLRTAMIARLDVRGHRANMPAELDNRAYRYAAYRFFTYWIHGLLGKGVRRVIPACCVLRIRQEFPAGNDQPYTGFKRGPDGEQVEVPEQFAI